MQVLATSPITYDTLLERILAQGDDVSMLTYARNQLRQSCGTNCNYTWKTEESFALKDPLTGCRVYMGLSKTDTEVVSRQIEKIFDSDQPRLIKNSVITILPFRQFNTTVHLTTCNFDISELQFKSYN